MVIECSFDRLKGIFGALRRPMDINLRQLHMSCMPVLFYTISVCRVPSTADTWCSVFGFARSTTMK